jgi:hypothetical protein
VTAEKVALTTSMKARPESKKNRPRNLTRNDAVDSDPDWQPSPATTSGADRRTEVPAPSSGTLGNEPEETATGNAAAPDTHNSKAEKGKNEHARHKHHAHATRT